jgi:hypothetical protein
MRSSPAEARPMALGRSPDPLDQVDYRLAQTPEQKDEIYRLRYRAYLREGAIQPSADGRVIDQFEDAPNAWTFGVYFHGELYSSIRVSVLTSEWRMSPSVELFGDVLHPKLDKGMVIKGAEFSGASLRDCQVGLHGRRPFQCRLWIGDRASRASGVLPARVPA